MKSVLQNGTCIYASWRVVCTSWRVYYVICRLGKFILLCEKRNSKKCLTCWFLKLLNTNVPSLIMHSCIYIYIYWLLYVTETSANFTQLSAVLLVKPFVNTTILNIINHYNTVHLIQSKGLHVSLYFILVTLWVHIYKQWVKQNRHNNNIIVFISSYLFRSLYGIQ